MTFPEEDKQKRPFAAIRGSRMPYHILRARIAKSLLAKIWDLRSMGMLSHLIFLVFVPYFLLYYLWVRLVGLFSVQAGRLRMVAFLRTYFWWYMRGRGVEGHLTRPEPEYTGKGMLILSVRQDPMASLLFQQQFSYPVIVPVTPNLYRFPLSLFIPWRIIGRALPVMTYPDLGLDSDIDTIMALLHAGYPVLVYIHPGLVSPLDMPTAMVYGRLTELLQWEGPLYVSTMEGMHLYPAITRQSSFTIRCNMLPLSELVSNIESPTRTQKVERLVSFLGFQDYRFISKPF